MSIFVQPLTLAEIYQTADGKVIYGDNGLPQMTHLGEQLVRLYVNTWKFDPHFAEYMVCPVCGRYKSKTAYVDHMGFSCSGTPDHPHELAYLVDDWDINDLKKKWVSKFSSPHFVGWLLMDRNRVIGFTWGRLMDHEEVAKRWGADEFMMDFIFQHTPWNCVVYYDELGLSTIEAYRHHGYGRKLVHLLTSHFKNHYPDRLTLLRTHEHCYARKLYDRVGYQQFTTDVEHGQNRIMMWADCSQLHPEALEPIPL